MKHASGIRRGDPRLRASADGFCALFAWGETHTIPDFGNNSVKNPRGGALPAAMPMDQPFSKTAGATE